MDEPLWKRQRAAMQAEQAEREVAAAPHTHAWDVSSAGGLLGRGGPFVVEHCACGEVRERATTRADVEALVQQWGMREAAAAPQPYTEPDGAWMVDHEPATIEDVQAALDRLKQGLPATLGYTAHAEPRYCEPPPALAPIPPPCPYCGMWPPTACRHRHLPVPPVPDPNSREALIALGLDRGMTADLAAYQADLALTYLRAHPAPSDCALAGDDTAEFSPQERAALRQLLREQGRL